MTDLLDHIKTLARKNSCHAISSYNQRLEVAVRLLTGAESLNHLTSSPEAYSLDSSLTVKETLRRFQMTESFFESYLDSESMPGLVGGNVLQANELAAEYWSDLLKDGTSTILDRLCMASDLNEIPFAQLPNVDGTLEPMVKNSSVPYDFRLTHFLTYWFLHEAGPGPDKYEHYIEAAKQLDFSDEVQRSYKRICRESINHSWSPNTVLLLGVLGNPVERLKRFDKEQILEQLEAIWESEEPQS